MLASEFAAWAFSVATIASSILAAPRFYGEADEFWPILTTTPRLPILVFGQF